MFDRTAYFARVRAVDLTQIPSGNDRSETFLIKNLFDIVPVLRIDRVVKFL